MFELDPLLDRIPVAPDAIERVAWSLNLTPVAGTDFAGVEARAYAVIEAAGGGRAVCYVCLYVPSLDRVQVYRHRASPFAAMEGEAHEGEALAFLEELGFILERLDYPGMSREERREWFDRQPPFHARRPPPPESPPPTREEPARPHAAPAAPPAPAGSPEMEGLLVLADSPEAAPPPPPAPGRRVPGKPTTPARAVGRASQAPAVGAGGVPAPAGPGKVDLSEEYEDLARLLGSL